MRNALWQAPRPRNEPTLDYSPGSPERREIEGRLNQMLAQEIEIPIFIGGEEIRGGELGDCRCPHDHAHRLGRYFRADAEVAGAAVEAALAARQSWAAMPWEERAAIFHRAADRLGGPWRATMNAATMLDLGKSVHQAEIDAGCELTDFLRFGVAHMTEIYRQQPESTGAVWNRLEQRPLEGFVYAVSPFNFAALAGNLPAGPALMGNVVVWKPASSAVFVAHHVLRLLREAGLPDGVINMVPGSGSTVSDAVLSSPHLAGIHFTGSTGVFRWFWKSVGDRIDSYRTYPRLVGETGGKNFVFAHVSADLEELATAIVRGAFEFQGQKCSAASRAYIPASLWGQLREMLVGAVGRIRVGPPTDFSSFMGAVIDRAAFDSISQYIEYARNAPDAELVTGGGCDDSIGYFIEPTIILTTNPKFKTMQEEIFGPVMTIFVYSDDHFSETLRLCDETSPYGLTGTIFARDRRAIAEATEALVHAAGNFYINDKPTGAVVGQQPFGGSRASGTNDKAGSVLNLLNWVTPRTIKENFLAPRAFAYPHMFSETEEENPPAMRGRPS